MAARKLITFAGSGALKGALRATAVFTLVVLGGSITGKADEIRLKDGKKLYGVIVAYEDNMFKVKTDYGYVLVEKDKIASIVPATPAAAKPEPQPAASKDKSLTDATPPATNASGKTADPAVEIKHEKTPAKFESTASKPVMPASTTATNAAAPAINTPSAPKGALIKADAPAAPPKEPELPAMREEVQGNLYTNYTHGFRMYKAPSWSVIEDARMALPNAIVAMGTFNESTLMVVGQEKTKEPLDAAATTVEKRLREVYENYRRISQRKTTVGGLPAVEYHYRGMADGHDWSGTLAVIGHGSDVFSVLGMTYAETDLIQIQENVIARAISSLNFDVH